jgi:2,4'-dihydroxyacetophenone dioxygenase
VRDATPFSTLLVHPDDVPYAVLERPYGRTLMKLVHVSIAQQTFTNIIRWEAGIELPRHLHTGPVHAFTFEGRWRYLEYEWEATAGSYVYEPPGTTHTLRVEEPVIAMFVSLGAFIWYDQDGRMASYQDATSTLADYRAALASQGLELPSAVVSG